MSYDPKDDASLFTCQECGKVDVPTDPCEICGDRFCEDCIIGGTDAADGLICEDCLAEWKSTCHAMIPPQYSAYGWTPPEECGNRMPCSRHPGEYDGPDTVEEARGER